jgi:hypothetical protein
VDPLAEPVSRVTKVLDGDDVSCCPDCGTVPVTKAEVNPSVTIKVRVRTGYDEDGTPTFEWTTLLTETAIVWVSREEFDGEAGFTLVRAMVTVPYESETQVPETAMLFLDDGTRWRIVGGVQQWTDRLVLEVERLDANRG